MVQYQLHQVAQTPTH